MNTLLLITGGRSPKTIDVTRARYFLPLLLLLFLLSGLFIAAGYYMGRDIAHSVQNTGASEWYSSLLQNREDIKRLSRQTTNDLDALALRLGQMEARSIRLDALGSRLIDVAGLEAEEFDFIEPPAVGGPSQQEFSSSNQMPSLMKRFTELQQQIDDREHKFLLLESIMMNRELEKQVRPNGWPIKTGWMSSRYGHRSDPFTGQRAWHAGVDFAGKNGSDVVAVASGVVTWSGDKNGYGNLIEVSHGNGLVTRYGHNTESLVKVGDTVEKGFVIAKMGSSGRSTGPHVHFEVLKDGKAVNPEKYVKSTATR